MKGIKGFTLLEVVIALAIFAIGMVGVLSLFPVSFGISKRTTDLTEATIYAQQKIEGLKRQGYDRIMGGYTGIAGGTFPLPDDSDSRFKYVYVVSQVSTGLKKISLTVRWDEGGKTYDEDFATYMADLTP